MLSIIILVACIIYLHRSLMYLPPSPRRHSTSTSHLAATSAAHTSICRNSLCVSRYTAISYFQVAAIHVSISLQGNYISQYLVSAIIFYHYAFHHHPRCLYYLSSSQSHVFASNFILFSPSSIKVISTICLHAFLHLPSF